jgi:hypothetical protein
LLRGPSVRERPLSSPKSRSVHAAPATGTLDTDLCVDHFVKEDLFDYKLRNRWMVQDRVHPYQTAVRIV